MKEQQYFPFLVTKSLYRDYWTVVCPEKVRPLILSKAAIRGEKQGVFYHRKIVFENKQYEILYLYTPVIKKHMSGNDMDDMPLLDTGGREIHMFYGIFGIKTPFNSILLELAKNSIMTELNPFLNKKGNILVIPSRPIELRDNVNYFNDDLDVKVLDPLYIDSDIFIDTKEQVRYGDTKNIPEPPKEGKKNVIENPIGEKPEVKGAIEPENYTDFITSDKNKTSPVDGKKVGGSILVLLGLGLAVSSGVIGVASALVTGAGVALISSDKKGENKKPNENGED